MATNHYFSSKPSAKPNYGLIRVNLRDRYFEFLTASGVFSKKRVDLGTRLLIESMVLPESGNVLDLGCGYGAVGIVAAASYPLVHVYMVDVNARAMWLARENARRNRVDNVVLRGGFLYEPLKDMEFDAILSNPPVSAGLKVVVPIIEQAPGHLTSCGSLQMVVRSKIGGRRLSGVMEEAFGQVEVLARQSGYRVLLSKKP
ncbi:MAG TPA: class I SAM-dependent methyltransferase [Candidatus Krumholzibacteriaceae bacterium]|nr:class I SAM-dependent methyltransferase [Candidatus Krumholzibacteriaceae bacterium]